MSMATNPPWADKLLNENWDAIQETMQSRGLPLECLPTHSQGRTKIHPSKELGCGHYGCVYQTGSPNVVCKITTDISEAMFIAIVNNMEETLPQGLVRYFDILALQGKRGKRDAFILWREEAFGFVSGITPEFRWDSKSQKFIRKDRVPEFLKGDPDENYRRRLWREFEDLLFSFLKGARVVREEIEKRKKRMNEEEYWNWVEGQFAEVDKNWSEFYETLYTGGPPSIHHGVPYLYSKHPLNLAFKLFMLFDTADKMVNSNGSYLIGEVFTFFLEKKILLADVHLANIAFVNRDDPDFASGIPIIVDPGHAVFLSREYSEVPVEGVGE
jgi:hypothetical protein